MGNGYHLLNRFSGSKQRSGRVSAGELEEQTFVRSEIRVSDRPVDRVHGSGIIGDRCSEENQERISNRFCEMRGFTRASAANTDFSVEVNATGFHPSTNNFQNVSSLDIFTEITCVRPVNLTVSTGQTFSGSDVKHRDKRIDRCLHGVSFGTDGCSQASTNRVADEFVDQRVSGRNASTDPGRHWRSLGVRQGRGLEKCPGHRRFSFVRCQTPTEDAAGVEASALESKTFRGDDIKVASRFVDRCVHGDGIVGDRCSTGNQRKIANKFCQRKEFDHSSTFASDVRVELNSIGFFPSSDSFRNVSSTDVFTEIACVRPPQ